MIDLPEHDLALVRTILARHLPSCKVLVFGSRSRGNSHRFSDLDLAIESGTALDPTQLEVVRDAFSESDLPILVDLVDLRVVSDTFRHRIEESSQPL